MNPEAIRQRRNLVILSISLALYYVIGGNVEILGLALDQIPIAEPVAWIAIVFFIWRHWVHAKEDRKQSLGAVYARLSVSPLAESVGRAVFINVAQNARVTPAARQEALDAIAEQKLNWTLSWFSYQCSLSVLGRPGGVNIDQPVTAPWIKVAPIAWWLRVRLALTSEYIDPWLPYAAPLLALAACRWGAQLSSLFGETTAAYVGVWPL